MFSWSVMVKPQIFQQVMSEAELYKGCSTGDKKAFEQLYNYLGNNLFGVAMRYATTNKEAEDVLQDAFIKIYQNINSFSDNGSFFGWVRRIVVNTAINSYRKNFNQKEDTVEDISILNQGSENPDVFSNFSSSELLNLVRQLPDGYRMIFNLYVIEGYKHREIAEMLKISEGTSKSQLAKAKAMLQKMVVNAGIEVYG